MGIIKVQQHSFLGGIRMAGWLFTVGFLQLTFWKGVLAIIVWPYFVGVFMHTFVH